MEERIIWGLGDNRVECDLSNAIYLFVITAFGGADKQVVINIILAANKSDALDKAAENLLKGAPKQLTELINAYINKGFAIKV